MKISWSQLHRLPVVTESGTKLGIIEGVTVDVEAHTVVNYEIKPGKSLLALFSKPLLVAPSEVVAINAERMIVKDTVTPVKVPTTSKKTRLAMATPDSEVDLAERD